MEVQSDVSRRRTCATYAGDMHALENHMCEAFERQLAITKESHDANALVHTLVATTKRHSIILNDLVSSLGDKEKIVTDKLKSAVAGFFGAAAGIVDSVRPMAVSKALRDDYTAISHAIVGYVMLSTTAASLLHEETKRIADEFLNEWIDLSQRIMTLIPTLALRDITDSGIQLLDLQAASGFCSTKQWSVLFSRQSITEESHKSHSTSKSHLPDALAAPNKIIVEKQTALTAGTSIGVVDNVIVETIVKPVIVEETFRPEKIVEVQPIIHREIQAPEVHHIERHIFEKVETTHPTVVTNKAIIQEVIKPHIIEEVQEIVHRELPAPYVEKVEKHITELEVMPTLHTKEVILEKEEVLKADLIVEETTVKTIEAKKHIEITGPEVPVIVGLSAGAPLHTKKI